MRAAPAKWRWRIFALERRDGASVQSQTKSICASERALLRRKASRLLEAFEFHTILHICATNQRCTTLNHLPLTRPQERVQLQLHIHCSPNRIRAPNDGQIPTYSLSFLHHDGTRWQSPLPLDTTRRRIGHTIHKEASAPAMAGEMEHRGQRDFSIGLLAQLSVLHDSCQTWH